MANKNIPTQIYDSAIRTQVDLERYSEGLRRKVVGILNTAQKEIISEIAVQNPLAPALTKWKTQRLTNLQQSINGILDKNYAKIKRRSSRALNDLATHSATSGAKKLNDILGVDLFNVTLTEDYLKSIVDNTMIDGQVIGKWWDEQKASTKKRLGKQMADASQAVQAGLVKGESIGELARRVRGTVLKPGVMQVSRREATALVRTSVMQVAQESRMGMYKANADLVKGVEAVATLDTRTTFECMNYDGKKWDLEGKSLDGSGVAFPGNPPYHWQCRTTLMTLLKSFDELRDAKGMKSATKKKVLELPESVRASMDGPVRGNLNYGQWLKTQSESVQIDVLGKARRKIWLEKGLSMKDLVHQNGRPLTIKQLEAKVVIPEKPPTPTMLSKIKKAKESHLPVTKEIRKVATLNEEKLATTLKNAKQLPDNEPFDVIVGSQENPKHLIEVKTIVRGKNDKITMHKDSLARKLAEAGKHPDAKTHTVVFDERTGKFYYNEGLGSFRLKNMKSYDSLNDVVKAIEREVIVPVVKKIEKSISQIVTTHKQAIEYAQEIGKTQGVESAFVYDAKGNIIFKKLGEARTVSFTDAEYQKMKKAILVHNHPDIIEHSLSNQDLMLAKTAGLNKIVAVTPQGTQFIATAKNYSYPMEVRASQGVDKLLADAYSSKLISSEDCVALQRHLVNATLDRMNQIKYIVETPSQAFIQRITKYEVLIKEIIKKLGGS